MIVTIIKPGIRPPSRETADPALQLAASDIDFIKDELK